MIVAMGRPRQGTVAALDMRRKQNTFNSFLFLCHPSATPRWSNRSRRRWQFFIPRLADMHVHANRTREPAASREFVEDIRNTEKICSVALNGRRLGRGDLDALLADAEHLRRRN